MVASVARVMNFVGVQRRHARAGGNLILPDRVQNHWEQDIELNGNLLLTAVNTYLYPSFQRSSSSVVIGPKQPDQNMLAQLKHSTAEK